MTKQQLRRSLYIAVIVMAVAFLSMATATFAWYIYNTGAHTTKVHMAAGSSVSLQISGSYNGTYSTSVSLSNLVGKLNPVSTDQIVSSSDTPLFQRASRFEEKPSADEPGLFAKYFDTAKATDFFKTSLYIKSGGGDCALYISNIGYTDSSTAKPLSTAIRVGFVTHTPGASGSVSTQRIFEINPTGHNPEAKYNTYTGQEGYVLDSSKTDGATVPFTPYTSANYAKYDSASGAVSLQTGSVKLADIKADSNPICVDVYIWLEGCDSDCIENLIGESLKNISVQFAGY